MTDELSPGLYETILDAGLDALRRYAFGEKWLGSTSSAFDHVFASVQSRHANNLEHLAADHFDRSVDVAVRTSLRADSNPCHRRYALTAQPWN